MELLGPFHRTTPLLLPSKPKSISHNGPFFSHSAIVTKEISCDEPASPVWMERDRVDGAPEGVSTVQHGHYNRQNLSVLFGMVFLLSLITKQIASVGLLMCLTLCNTDTFLVQGIFICFVCVLKGLETCRVGLVELV